MLKRLVPHPHLSLVLVAVWLGLVNKVTLGNLALGAFLGVVVPMLTAPYWPNRPKVGRLDRIIVYAAIVIYDIIKANIEVALIILFKRNEDIRSRWLVIPLELTSGEAITALAGTITLTPGTVSATLSADCDTLLVHCLHTDDPDDVIATIKSRYERRLKEIFQ